MKQGIIALVAAFLLLHKTEGTNEAKSSLAFVIDSTGSMSDDIHEEMTTTDKNFDAVVTSNASQIEDFILVTFADPECRLDIRTDFDSNTPLMLTINKELPKFQVTNGNIIIAKEESIILYCPSTSFAMRGYRRSEIKVTCEDDKTFNYEGIKQSFTDFKCKNKIKATLRRTKQPCSNENSELNDVGYFTNDTRSFIKVYQLCLDEKHATLYSKLNLQPTLANVLPNYGFNNISNKYLTTLFDCNYQNNEFSAILDYDFHKTDGCCFAKRQFVSPKDVAPGVPQRATYTQNNVVPQWSTCNSQNWDDVEERIRRLVVAANRELQVWTGTAQALQMIDANYILRNITIPIRRENQSVPLFLWKVVQDPERNASLAIIQVNVPDLTQERASSYVRCRDVCDSVDWMRNRRWLKVDRGYTYCCELSDFERAFRYSGIFPRHLRLLTVVD